MSPSIESFPYVSLCTKNFTHVSQTYFPLSVECCKPFATCQETLLGRRRILPGTLLSTIARNFQPPTPMVEPQWCTCTHFAHTLGLKCLVGDAEKASSSVNDECTDICGFLPFSRATHVDDWWHATDTPPWSWYPRLVAITDTVAITSEGKALADRIAGPGLEPGVMYELLLYWVILQSTSKRCGPTVSKSHVEILINAISMLCYLL